MKRTFIPFKTLVYTFAFIGSVTLISSCSKENSKVDEQTTTENSTANETASTSVDEGTPSETSPSGSMEETAKKFAELNCKSQEIALKMQKQGTQDLTQLTNDQNEITSKLAEVEDDAKYYEKENKDTFDKLVAKYMGSCKN